MNEIEHTPEPEAKAKARQAKAALASAYQAAFGTPEGQRVLADLRAKYGLSRRRFDPRDRNPSSIAAAIVEGECNVLRDIEAALLHASR